MYEKGIQGRRIPCNNVEEESRSKEHEPQTFNFVACIWSLGPN